MSKIITLSEAASIALHGMVLVAKTDHKLNVNQIAEVIDSSRHHVAKVFQRLAKENFVASNRGPSGGFVMKKDPKDITLLELYEVIEGPVEVQGCPGNKERCPFDKCIMGDLAAVLAREFRDFLARQTLADYI